MAPNNTLKDALATHSITNYLLASHQGKFAFLTALSELKHPSFNAAELTLTRRALERIDTWTQDLWKGLCLFSATWTQIETFDAEDALDLLTKQKADLSHVSSQIKKSWDVTDLTLAPDDTNYLIAAFTRFAHSRDSYLQGLAQFETVFHPPEPAKQVDELRSISFPADYVAAQSPAVANQIGQATAQIPELVPLAQQFISIWKNPADMNAAFYAILRHNTYLLPYIFRAHTHDINQLLSRYRGGFSYAAAQFSQKETEAWSSAGFGALPAGYWRAYDMSPSEAALWVEVGVREPEAGREWLRYGFNQSAAAPWLAQTIPPPLARIWALAGFSANETRSWLERGISDPAQIQKPS